MLALICSYKLPHTLIVEHMIVFAVRKRGGWGSRGDSNSRVDAYRMGLVIVLSVCYTWLHYHQVTGSLQGLLWYVDDGG